MPFLELQSITKRFGRQTVLDGISADVERGELVTIVGPSGCGKTTLLRIIAGLERAEAGRVLIDGVDATDLAPAKRNYGIVFQSYALFPNMTVLGNVMFGLRQRRWLAEDERQAQALTALRMVGLYEHRDKYPRQLSGGMQQRTALARAIAPSPAFLLLDEPLSALDAKVRAKLRGEIRSIQRTLGVTTVMVTHDQEEAMTMADRIIVMNDAVVEQVGSPRQVYDSPASPFVANFIGSMNFLAEGADVVCIRPEKVEVVGRGGGFDCIVKVRSLEFRGAMTRVYGGLLPALGIGGGSGAGVGADGASAADADSDELCLDLPTEQAVQLRLALGATLFLRLPEQHQIRYAGSKLA
jgi:iron(III) transport system ATP-binding protein